MKVKVTKKPELEETIIKFAKLLQLYDPKFPDPHVQSGGFYAFKALCMTAEELPDSIDNMYVGQHMIVTPVIACIQKLHPSIRKVALAYANHIRNPKKQDDEED